MHQIQGPRVAALAHAPDQGTKEVALAHAPDQGTKEVALAHASDPGTKGGSSSTCTRSRDQEGWP
jgi:hypothetical protein